MDTTGSSGVPVVAILGTRGYPSFYGGFETAVRFLVPHLASEGWSVRVYSREDLDDFDSHEGRVEVVRTRGVESTALSTLSFGLTATIHAIRRKPDIVLVMNVANGYYIPALRLFGIPVVTNVDGMEWERQKWSRLAKLVFRGGAWLTAKFSNELIVDARAIGARWQQIFGREGRFIPYGSTHDRDQTDRDLPFRPKTYVLYVARFVPENSTRQFLESAATFASEDMPVVVVGTGSADLEMTARDLQQSTPWVKWLGHVSDDAYLDSLWENSLVYFHGHTVGGTNPALVQAMACGANVVARDTVFNREVLAELATFVGGDSGQITAGITAASVSPTDPSKVRARAKINYSWSRINKDYAELLRETWEASSQGKVRRR